MPAMHSSTYRRFWRSLPWLAALLLLWTASSVFAQEADPPGRVATLSYRQGGVVFAPAGDDEWIDLPPNRPLTNGDRLWTDNGARAELQLGAATLHVDGESHLGVGALDERSAQFILLQGTVNARVRELVQGDNFEIDTPNLALRASQPGDYRIDVTPDGRETRVVVMGGMATVYGEGGDSLNLGAGQQATFGGRYLAQVQGAPFQGDAFSQWAGERNRAEDLSAAARHVPRGVVGYSELDAYGTWGQDPTYGEVWYPQSLPTDWAPYRYGEWLWVAPWGWTWVDDAPWGFAPFHYGRWAQIGTRWAWVPGRLVTRPVYSPALVVFLGGGGAARFTGWYPLGPGEAWWPSYRASQHYVGRANININLTAYPRHFEDHMHRQRAGAVTTVRVEDFRPGSPVHNHWQPVQPGVLGQAQVGVVPPRPERRMQQFQPQVQRLQAAPPMASQQLLPSRSWAGGRGVAVPQRQVVPAQVQPHFIPQPAQVQVQPRVPQQAQQRPQWEQQRPQWEQQRPQWEQQRPQWDQQQRQQWEQDRALREQAQARHQQERLQREAERNARVQQWEATRQRQQQDLAQQQREAVQRQQPHPLGPPSRVEPPPQQQHERVRPDAREARGQRDDEDRPAGRGRGWGRD